MHARTHAGTCAGGPGSAHAVPHRRSSSVLIVRVKQITGVEMKEGASEEGAAADECVLFAASAAAAAAAAADVSAVSGTLSLCL